MIAASEPLEFIPHGRTVVGNHPGPIYKKGQSHNVSISENSLLYKLTNFAIKDESLVEAKEEQEWWCIREVFYRQDEEEDIDEPQSKEDHHDLSESFRPPSRLKNEFNISIKSEIMSGVKKMETECGSTGTSQGGSANSSSNMSKKFHLNNNSAGAKRRTPNIRTDSSYEEELYVKGCTAVWSKGLISTPATKLSGPEQRETIACYTIDNPIKHAAFCNFYININNTMLIDALNSQIGDSKQNIKIEDTTEHLKPEIMPSILLMDNKCMKVFAVDGREYITTVPFQVKKVWPMKYGILLEKDATNLMQNSIMPLTSCSMRLNESNNSTFSRSRSNYPFNMSAKLRAESMSGYDQDVPLPTCFSMSHPLDEVTPLLMKSPTMGLHYYNDGDLQIIFVSTKPSIILLYDWKLGTHSLWRIRKAVRDECLVMCPNFNSTTTVFSQTCDFANSMPSNKNVSSWATCAGSPYSKHIPTTPNLSRSKHNSPMANYFHQQGMSPHASIGQASSASMMANTMAQGPPSLPLYPDICLDHIWTDSQTIRRDPVEQECEMKTFLHTDLVGQDYLCFMVKVAGVSRLQVARLKVHSSGSSSSNLIVGSVSSVQARDAVVLEHLKMIAFIDETGNIMLQSGTYLVGKVHVGGILARLLSSPYSRGPASPFPRRSSLLPSRSDAGFDTALHLLSPVPHERPRRAEPGLVGISDAAGSLVTLRFSEGAMYRIALPAACHAGLVRRAAAALSAALPPARAAQVLIKWYGVRNAPGTQDLTPEQEWSMFSNLLLSLIGYDIERLQARPTDECGDSSEVASKKQKTSNDGTQDDWDFLLNSKLHKTIGNPLANMLNMTPVSSTEPRITRQCKRTVFEEKPTQFNTNTLLFTHTLQILFSFHLVYEELKLNTLLYDDLKMLAPFLYQISRDLKLENYMNHYWLDFPTLFSMDVEGSESQMSEAVVKKLTHPNYFSKDPPNIFSYLNSMLKEVDVGSYPHLPEVNDLARDLIEMLLALGSPVGGSCRWQSARDLAASTPEPRGRGAPPERALRLIIHRGMTPELLETIPAGVALILQTVFNLVRPAPPSDLPPAAYALLARPDLLLGTRDPGTELPASLSLQVHGRETAFSLARSAPDTGGKEDNDALTGMEHLNTRLLSLLYPRDHRMCEVFNLLQSSIPASVNLPQRPEVSDHEFLEEQEKYLYALSTRTTALPIARGMVTLRTLPCPAPPGPRAPRMCAGRGRAAEPGAWPAFHNAAAAGLALCPAPPDPRAPCRHKQGGADASAEHAGHLLALGLNGHLRDMPFMDMYECLVKCNETLSVGLLLGIAASYKGTMDVQATKMMSIHLEPLLPPTCVELDMQQNVLVAALLGVGLLYMGTAHHHHATLLLQEIGKPPGPELEQCAEREGYALAAGLALGMVCVGAAARAPPGLAPALRQLMLGGDRRDKPGTQKDKYKSSTLEPVINLDVTSPGGTAALGLLYLRSHSRAHAQWLQPPKTHYLLHLARPDLLLYRLLARGLIMWDEIEACEEWIEQQVPPSIRPHCFVKPSDENVDYEAMNQAYCNIIAGVSFSVGLRFAGTGDLDARDAVLHHAKRMLAHVGRAGGELAGRATLETCVCVCVLAAGMIMAGRGDLEVMRICRRLRARVGAAPTAGRDTHALTHGGQMAVHMALGLQFLMGGRGTLGRSPAAVAALLTAFFPKFPTHSEDNRYHLQAFRHLYVLAVEPRLILPRDIDSGKLCYAYIQVIDLQGVEQELKAPCIIPELDTLREVKIQDPRYWPIAFHRDRNWDRLEAFLEHTSCIDLKQRAGRLPHHDDPRGQRALLQRALTTRAAPAWAAPEPPRKHQESETICADCLLVSSKRKGAAVCGARACCCRREGGGARRAALRRRMAACVCEHADLVSVLPVWDAFLKIIKTMETEPSSYHMWQIKLLLSQIENQNKQIMNEMKIDDQDTQNEPLIPTEFTLAMKQEVSNIFDAWESKINPFVKRYIGLPSTKKFTACDGDLKKILSAYLVYHDIPKGALKDNSEEKLLSLTLDLLDTKISADAANKIDMLVR